MKETKQFSRTRQTACLAGRQQEHRGRRKSQTALRRSLRKATAEKKNNLLP